MAQTKKEKIQVVEEGGKEIDSSQTILFTTFSKTPVSELQKLRMALRAQGGKLCVFKKRLLKIMLTKKGFDGFDPRSFEGQLGVVFGSGDISSIAQPAYKFSKDHEGFSLTGGIDIVAHQILSAEMVTEIGGLPSREELLGKVMGACIAPLRVFMYLLQERAKQLETEK
ncbi:MAG: 50S ribosomal protein L10 [bacterium]